MPSRHSNGSYSDSHHDNQFYHPLSGALHAVRLTLDTKSERLIHLTTHTRWAIRTSDRGINLHFFRKEKMQEKIKQFLPTPKLFMVQNQSEYLNYPLTEIFYDTNLFLLRVPLCFIIKFLRFFSKIRNFKINKFYSRDQKQFFCFIHILYGLLGDDVRILCRHDDITADIQTDVTTSQLSSSEPREDETMDDSSIFDVWCYNVQ